MNKIMIDNDLIKVLIADDEPLIRMDLKELLEESSTYQVVAEARSGLEAVENAKRYKPDVIFLDIRMPEMDGIEAARRIQEELERRVPIIMLTAYSQKELYEGASKAGVFAYLTKPLRKADLGPAIEIAISRALELEGLKDELSKLNEKLEVRKLVDRAKGLLQQQLKIDEPTAYRNIQKSAMDKRCGMKKIAEEIINELGGN
jgi:two-component system, response regulator PdtaR